MQTWDAWILKSVGMTKVILHAVQCMHALTCAVVETQSQHGPNSRILLQWWPFLTNFQHQTSFITNAAHSRTAPSSFLPALKHLTFGIPEPGHWPDLMVSWMLVSDTYSLLRTSCFWTMAFPDCQYSNVIVSYLSVTVMLS